MSDADNDPRWEGFLADFEQAAQLVPVLDPFPDAAGTMAQLLGDGNHPLALIIATDAVRFSDGRAAALRLAELLEPRARLMLQYPYEPEFQALEVETALPAYERIIRLLSSVIDAHRTGRAVPPEFRAQVEAWWDGLVAEGDLDQAMATAKLKYAAGDGGDERFWFHEILLDWLYVDDQWRWQAALVLLHDGLVARAVPEMRSAADYAVDDKAPFADTFRRYADELEQATATS